MKLILYIAVLLLNISLVFPKNFMWEVQSETNTCYILGSVHLADSSLYPLAPEITNAFDKSKALVLEIDISNINPMEVLKFTMLPDTNTLAGAVDPSTYKKFVDLFKKHNVPAMSYSKLKPWFAVMTLQSLEMIEGNYSAEYGIDMYFLDKAQSKNLKIKALETLEFQMKVLDTLNNFSGKFLDYTLEELSESAAQVSDILSAWKNGDTQKMNEIINDGSDIEGFSEVMHIINNARNYNMVDKIEGFLGESDVHFVVVGAAHLIGPEGIIELLKSKNKYKITQR